MDDLEKTVTGDWFDLKEISENLRDLEEFFSLTASDFESMIQNLKLAVEGGVVEFKRNIILPIFTFLESMQYDSKGMDSLVSQAASLSPLIYMIFLQRLISRGTIPLRKEKLHFDPDKAFGVKEIIQDVNSRLKQNPELSQHAAIKNILSQVGLYKQELENMKKLSPNIPKEKAESFSENFKKVFSEIHARIQEKYSSFLKEEVEKTRDSTPHNPLEVYDLKPLSKLLLSQVQMMARIRSTLTFAEKEGFQTRSILVSIFNDRVNILNTIDKEMKQYKTISGSDDAGVHLSKTFASEIAFNLDKAVKRLRKETVSQ